MKTVIAVLFLAASYWGMASAGAAAICDTHDDPNGAFGGGTIFKAACWDGSVDQDTVFADTPDEWIKGAGNGRASEAG